MQVLMQPTPIGKPFVHSKTQQAKTAEGSLYQACCFYGMQRNFSTEVKRTS